MGRIPAQDDDDNVLDTHIKYAIIFYEECQNFYTKVRLEKMSHEWLGHRFCNCEVIKKSLEESMHFEFII